MSALLPPNLRARKRFGQNFLIDERIIEGIVDAIHPCPSDHLVEIGPGHAALTSPVLERAGRLTAIELDRDLAEILRHDPFLKGLNLIEADALKFDYRTLEGYGELRIFGNLPYNITSPLLLCLLALDGVRDLHFMLQREVVDRLVAAPGSGDYGRLTVIAQHQAQILPVMEVPPTAFRPMPKVNSAVVRLIPRKLSAGDRALLPRLEEVTRVAFGTRRKVLRNSLSKLLSAAEMEELGVDSARRAEELPVAKYVALARHLASRPNPPLASATR
ncbi:MAG: 16S rRNA (adenine(1518)-N(6)/adenine(1519)-N(6))-dimethyltransferase RsmA [Succinivibrionaceae bacterium]|nr:16S rRNA (adenine(1518)-N(6)/adenine(1519)-N(6))-dimethyltransferase RsmA [Succinivibrionaceae bacterium]